MSHVLEIQTFVFERLTQALANYEISVPVANAPQAYTPMPYIEINSMDSFNEDAINAQYYRHVLRLIVWCNVQANKRVLEIMDIARSALHYAQHEWEDGRIITMSVRHMMTRRDVDNITFAGHMTIDIDSEYK